MGRSSIGNNHLIRRIFKRFFQPTPSTLSSLDAYQQWANRYPAHAHNRLMEIEEATMRQLMPDIAGKVVVDAACGTGRYGLIAKQMGAKFVFGFDNSAAMLSAGELKLASISTVEKMPLANNSVDVLICGLALGHLPFVESPFAEISRVLRVDGIVLVSDFHPIQFLNGAKRTFRGDDGRLYAVEHYPHLYADYHRASQDSGLQLDAIIEPTLSADSQVPIVLVMRFVKLAH